MINGEVATNPERRIHSPVRDSAGGTLSDKTTTIPIHMVVAIGVLVAGQACGGTSTPAGPTSPLRTTSTLSGTCDGTRDAVRCTFSGTFAVSAAGAVDASAIVNGFSGPMALVILGQNPASTTGTSCGVQFLSAPLSTSSVGTAPTIAGHWDSVPAGTYCVNVAPVPVPATIPPYTWTVSVTHP